MRSLLKRSAAFALGLAALGGGAAFAADDDHRRGRDLEGARYEGGRGGDDHGYDDRGGRYQDRSYADRRGYRNYGRVVDRDIYPIRGYRADAVVVEEVFGGRRGYSRLVCTVTARGPDAHYVPYGQLRRIAYRTCSGRSEIRVYA